MGTRSTIAIQNEDGTVTGIYCHWDGYLSHNGDILQKFYTTEEKVRALIALGDLSSLGEQIGSKHDFNNAPDDECNAYGRDRGETGCEPATEHNWRQYRAEYGQEYDYLFTPGAGWQVSTYNGIYDLAAALATEEENA
jgi:hypothetical protein